MSKSILVIDTPDSCDKCRLCCMGNYGSKRCSTKDQSIFLKKGQKKPDWCPLKDAPEKKEVRNFCLDERDFIQQGYQQGWNTCIEEMLGENK